jgi:hypothetical protein
MIDSRDQAEDRRRRSGREFAARVEALECRALLADGITPMAGAHLTATAGTALQGAVFATYTVSDASGAPGTQWRAKIEFGDGQVDKNVVPHQVGNTFEFVDSHTYQAAGAYTVTVLIAVPFSHKPNDNTVTTQVTVNAPSPTPTPTPTPAPSPTPVPTPTPTPPPAIGRFKASGVHIKAHLNKTLHATVARFSDPKTKAKQFHAVIAWGDGSLSTTGQIRTQAKGRFLVAGSHRYAAKGVFQTIVTIVGPGGQEIAATSSVLVNR